MRLIVRASDARYRAEIQDERNQGRLPLAWLTFGEISGKGWGFLHPWAQLALFSVKGTPAGIGHPERKHEAFLLLRVWPKHGTFRHPNHEEPIAGRYWYGLAWRRRWGFRRRCGIRYPAVRRVLLDPDAESVPSRWSRQVRRAYRGDP